MENLNINKEEEQFLEHFFAETKIDLPDNGFTERVMDNLTQTVRRRNYIWTVVCLLAAIILFLSSDGVTHVRVFVTNVVKSLTNSLSAIQLEQINLQAMGAMYCKYRRQSFYSMIILKPLSSVFASF